MNPPEEHGAEKASLFLHKDFKGYPLWVEGFISADDVPVNARIDDYTIAKLIDAGKNGKRLNGDWPVEFDQKKNIKAMRMPLGSAAKMFVAEGDLDRYATRGTFRAKSGVTCP